MAGYYYLVATLNEYSLSGDSKQMDFLSIRQEILDNLSSTDQKTVKSVLSYWDIQNLLNVLDNRVSQYSYIGNYSQQEIAELAQWYNDLVELSAKTAEERDAMLEQEPKTYDVVLSGVFAEVFKSIEAAEADDLKPIATMLFECYYSKLEKSKNKFVKQWGEFDRSVKNLSAAFEARKHSLEAQQVLVGSGFICKSIIENFKVEDFGLNEQEWVAEILKLLSSDDIIKKERGLDLLRWNKIDDLTTFSYFNLDFILGYILKLTMIGRWSQLDEKSGRAMFDTLVGRVVSPELMSVEQ